MQFFKKRGSGGYSIGLPLALFITSLTCLAFLYFSGSLDQAGNGVMARVDQALAFFLADFRTPAVVRVFSIVTAFGYWGVVVAMATTLSILLWLSRKSLYLIGLWVALAGNQISVNLLKAIFARVRPQLAYYQESSYAFPSGHSAVSAAFFGFLMYLAIRERIMAVWTAMTVGVLAILLIGLSRLILDEHYLSDVLSGYLVGAVWAVSGAWLVERGRSPDPIAPSLPDRSRAAELAIIVVGVLVVSLLAMNYRDNLVILPIPSAAP